MTTIQKSKELIRSFREYLNRELKTKIKHFLVAILLASFVNLMVIYHVNTLNEDKVQQLEEGRVQDCEYRKDVRDTLRYLLSAVYNDIFVLVPDSEIVREFNRVGLERIQIEYPPITVEECLEDFESDFTID